MNDYIPWYIPVGPKDKSFVVDGDNFVLSSDFPLHIIPGDRALMDNEEHHAQDIAATGAAKKKLHVLDLLDGKSQQDIIRIMAAAVDQPNRLVEREISLNSERKRVRSIHINSEGELLRTIVIVGPIK